MTLSSVLACIVMRVDVRSQNEPRICDHKLFPSWNSLGKREAEQDNQRLAVSESTFGSVGCDGKAIAATTVPGLLHGQWFSSSTALQLKFVTVTLHEAAL